MEYGVRAKSPVFLQEALIEEMKRITEDMLFRAPKKEELVKMEVFGQSLPIPKIEDTGVGPDNDLINYTDDQMADPIFKCPWCTVKVQSGAITEIDGPQRVEVVICFGIFDDDYKNKGSQQILALINRVYERFSIDPILDKQYTCTGTFEWALQEEREDTFPYFYGGIITTFNFSGYRRELKF